MTQNKNEAELTMLKSFARGNKDIIIKLIHVFLRNTPGMIDDLEKQILQCEASAVKQSIHKLASQFTFMNFDQGEKLLIAIKDHFDSGKQYSELIPFVKQLQDVCDGFYERLNNEINRLY